MAKRPWPGATLEPAAEHAIRSYRDAHQALHANVRTQLALKKITDGFTGAELLREQNKKGGFIRRVAKQAGQLVPEERRDATSEKYMGTAYDNGGRHHRRLLHGPGTARPSLQPGGAGSTSTHNSGGGTLEDLDTPTTTHHEGLQNMKDIAANLKLRWTVRPIHDRTPR